MGVNLEVLGLGAFQSGVEQDKSETCRDIIHLKLHFSFERIESDTLLTVLPRFNRLREKANQRSIKGTNRRRLEDLFDLNVVQAKRLLVGTQALHILLNLEVLLLDEFRATHLQDILTHLNRFYKLKPSK